MEITLSATGLWKIKNIGEKYHGDLYLNEDNGGIVVYFRIPNNGPPMSYLELPLSIPFITGSTFNGAKMTLINCIRISTESRVGSEEVFGYQAQYMINGVSFGKKADIKFTKMKISIPGIIHWGNCSNYTNPDLKDNETLIALKILEPIDIYSCDDYTLSYYLSFNSPFELMEEEIILKQTPFLIIEATFSQTLDWFMKIANNMKRLIEIAIGSPLGYGSMIVETPEIYYEFDDNKSYNRPLQVIHTFKEHINIKNENKRLLNHDYLFDLSDLRQADFSQWQEVSTLIEPVIELYIDSLYNKKLSVSRHFLNMVQALETYHSRRIANSLKDFKTRVDKLLDIRSESLRAEDKKNLLKGCKTFITLRSRLTDLLLAEFRFFFYTGNIKYLDFPQLIAGTRNYYTHYNPKDEHKALKDGDLLNAFYILQNLLEFYLLKELGFQEDFIHKKIQNRIERVRINNDIKNANEEKFRNES